MDMDFSFHTSINRWSSALSIAGTVLTEPFQGWALIGHFLHYMFIDHKPNEFYFKTQILLCVFEELGSGCRCFCLFAKVRKAEGFSLTHTTKVTWGPNHSKV